MVTQPSSPLPGSLTVPGRPGILARVLFLIGAISPLLNVPASGADSLITWKGEIRVRGEADGRDFRNATAPNLYALLRTRLGADIRPVKDLLVTIVAQDSRVFGQRLSTGSANTSANFKNLDLHEGFLRIDNLLTERLSMTLGRMGLSYGAERLVGRLDWSNVGRVFDGALVRFEPEDHILDVFATDIVELSSPPSPVTRSSVTSMGSEGYLFWGGHYTYAGLSGQTLNMFGFQELSHGDSTTGEIERSRWTVGGRAVGGFQGIFYEAEGSYQLGTQQGADISAYMLVGVLGYSFEDAPLRVLGGFEYLSGTPAGSSKVMTFEPMFPTAHKFWGIMDYFTHIPIQTYDRGLQDMYVSLVFRPVKTFSLAVTGHSFRLAESYVGRTVLGQEVDLIGNLAYNKYLTFEFGGGGFFPDEIMEFEFGGTDPGLWAYLTVQAKFW